MSSPTSTADPAAVRCPACGLELPGYARFCARCGTPQPSPSGAPAAPGPLRRGASPWIPVLFWIGTVVTLLVAVLYGAIAASPAMGAAAGLDPGQVRQSALVAAAFASALFAVQAIAAAGLTARRDWARVPATIACVGWALTCVGLPVAVLVLIALWRRPA